MQSIIFIKQTVSEKKIFKDFFRKLALFGTPATESCHSNQSSYLTGTKNNLFVEANARNMYSKYQLHKANSL